MFTHGRSRHPDSPRWEHASAPVAHDVRLHYVSRGTGPVLLLLHGWPGFWFDWRDVIAELSERGRVIAPDLRGFGRSDRPRLTPDQGYGAAVHAQDMRALLDHLAVDEAVIVAHDLGTTIAQAVALAAPERVRALVLCNPPYPGGGERRFEPAAQRELWYQTFHTLDLAERLARDRHGVRAYLAHFYEHWCGRPQRLRADDFEDIVEQYAGPGAFIASVAYYRAREGQRVAQAGADPSSSRIGVHTQILWGELDPVIEEVIAAVDRALHATRADARG